MGASIFSNMMSSMSVGPDDGNFGWRIEQQCRSDMPLLMNQSVSRLKVIAETWVPVLHAVAIEDRSDLPFSAALCTFDQKASYQKTLKGQRVRYELEQSKRTHQQNITAIEAREPE
jgi:hypothetical protein